MKKRKVNALSKTLINLDRISTKIERDIDELRFLSEWLDDNIDNLQTFTFFYTEALEQILGVENKTDDIKDSIQFNALTSYLESIRNNYENTSDAENRYKKELADIKKLDSLLLSFVGNR